MIPSQEVPQLANEGSESSSSDFEQEQQVPAVLENQEDEEGAYGFFQDVIQDEINIIHDEDEDDEEEDELNEDEEDADMEQIDDYADEDDEDLEE